MNELGFARFHLVGHDRGGRTGHRMALDRPDVVLSLAVLDIVGSCSDYRAAVSIDLEHDGADIEKKVSCPTLAFWGSRGAMHKSFDIGAAWRKRCADVRAETLPGGHFFVDQFPKETARTLIDFLVSI